MPKSSLPGLPPGSEKTDAGEVKTTKVEPAAVAARILIIKNYSGRPVRSSADAVVFASSGNHVLFSGRLVFVQLFANTKSW